MEEQKNLIESVLKDEEIAFEPIPEEQESPLSHPVVDRNQPVQEDNTASNEGNNSRGVNTDEQKARSREKPTDAPEQTFDEEPPTDPKPDGDGNDEEFTIPLEHATMVADSIIGTVNNVLLEVGGGYFITIRKHKDFYNFEEVIQVIDEQNVKNIKRLKLDEEDKALIRPLLVHILRKKTSTLSPEMQLLMVVLSILIKKAKAVMEIRAENEILVERIRDIIHKEMSDYHSDSKQDDLEDDTGRDTRENNESTFQEKEKTSPQHNTGLPDEVVEIID